MAFAPMINIGGVDYPFMDEGARGQITDLKVDLNYTNRYLYSNDDSQIPKRFESILDIELYPDNQTIPEGTKFFLFYIENGSSNRRLYIKACDANETFDDGTTCAQYVVSQSEPYAQIETFVTTQYNSETPYYFKITVDWTKVNWHTDMYKNVVINLDTLRKRTTPALKYEIDAVADKTLKSYFIPKNGIPVPEYYKNAVKAIYIDPISPELPAGADLNLWYLENNPSNKRAYFRIGTTICAQVYDETSGDFEKTYTTTQYQTNTAYYFKVTIDWSKAPRAGVSDDIAYINTDAIKQFEKLPYESGYIYFTVPVNQNRANGDSTALDTEDSETIVNTECVLSLPDNYTQDGLPCKLLMMCHGAGSGVARGTTNPWTAMGLTYGNIVSQFKQAGWAVFDCNGYNNTDDGHEVWGAPKGVECWRKAYEYVVDHYNVQKNFSIYGFSMGGLTALALAFSNFPNINAIALASPVLDLHAVWTADADHQGILEDLYDMTEWDKTKVSGSNPIDTLVTIDETEYCIKSLQPIKIWYGASETGDSYVSKSRAQRFVEAINNSNGYAIYREVSGAGHEVCSGAYPAINTEFVYWLNRFAN